jgi:transposase
MNSVGIDLHRKRSHVAALDERGGELFSRRIVNDPDTFVALLGDLDGESKIARGDLRSRTTATSCTWPTRSGPRRSPRRGLRPTPSTPAHWPICCAPTCCPRRMWPPGSCATCSDLLRQRVVLTQLRTALKNRVHALIARQGIQRAHADLFGSGGRRFLDDLRLRPDPRARLETLLRLIADFDREIGRGGRG